MVYNLNGISTQVPPKDKFWVSEFEGNFILKEGDLTYDLDSRCVQLYQDAKIKIFGSTKLYWEYAMQAPVFFAQGGLDAELNISKEDFEIIANHLSSDEISNKLFYFYDVANILSTLQNAIVETKFLLGQFYKTLNENSFLVVKGLSGIADGIQYSSGPIVTNITSLVNHLFINLYSQLDFATKLIFEFENIAEDFSRYPKLKCKDILFGDYRRTSLAGLPNSIYDGCENIKKIMSLRNEIVHNSSIDNLPKVYQVISKNQLIEKYILIPDLHNGFIKTYKNRKRFFHYDTKLNEILPALVIDFWVRLKNTLDLIR